MRLIAHRGNLQGKSDKENHPDQISMALSGGFEVEVDLHRVAGQFVLGHDTPQYAVEECFLVARSSVLWCHAKNLDALHKLIELGLHCFWHQEDDYTLTSKGHIWAYPGKKLIEGCIAVLPDTLGYLEKDIVLCDGICSDYVEIWDRRLFCGRE